MTRVVAVTNLPRPYRHALFNDSGGPKEVIEAVGGGRVVDSVLMLGSVLDQLRVGEGSALLRPLDERRLTALYDVRTTAKTYADLYLAAVREPSDRASGGA